MTTKLTFRESLGNAWKGSMKRVPRTCPVCGKRFERMSDVLWIDALTVHLITSKQHNFSAKEILDILKKTILCY